MLVAVDEPVTADTPGVDTLADDAAAWAKEMDDRGVRLAGNRVVEAHDSRTVRVRDGQLMVVDGPYVETKEIMGGFDILECADLDEAIAVAAQHPMARIGMIEVRPFWTG
jgi:hypothetical protein